MNLFMGWTATFVLGIWGSRTDVSVFNAASRTALLASLTLMTVNSVAAPKFAMLYQQGNLEALGSTARGATRMMLGFASPVFLLFFLAPSWTMQWFGVNFAAQGAATLMILAAGQLVNVATGSVGCLLMMTSNERLVRNNNIFAAIENLILNLLLVPWAGVIGAATAMALSVATANLVALYLVRSRLGIRTIPSVSSWYPTK
jgi:O-antigen/teichoic acid export membrane protein